MQTSRENLTNHSYKRRLGALVIAIVSSTAVLVFIAQGIASYSDARKNLVQEVEKAVKVNAERLAAPIRHSDIQKVNHTLEIVLQNHNLKAAIVLDAGGDRLVFRGLGKPKLAMSGEYSRSADILFQDDNKLMKKIGRLTIVGSEVFIKQNFRTQLTQFGGIVIVLVIIILPAAFFGAKIFIYRPFENLQRHRDQAVSANNIKSEFLAKMSHEIRTPMTSVLGLTDMLLDGELNPSQRDMAEKLKGASQSAMPLLNGILDLSKIQAGKLEAENIDFDIHALIVDVIDSMHSKASAKGLTLSWDLDPKFEAGFHSDPNRMRQVLLNLLENAINYTVHGSVNLKAIVAKCDGDRITVRFEITDTGIGIAKDRNDNLFENFSRLNTSAAYKPDGAGLGLAISKRLVEMMGGEIGFESAKGEGSTFWFTIIGKAAVSKSAKTRSSLLASDHIVSRSLRILLAEDNDLNQMIIKAMLSKFGHAVEAVDDGLAAINALRAGEFDLILMDIRMPEMDGPSASRVIRQEPNQKRNIPIVAITADAMNENRKLYFDAGMNYCVTKPIDLQELLYAINSVLGEDVHIITEKQVSLS